MDTLTLRGAYAATGWRNYAAVVFGLGDTIELTATGDTAPAPARFGSGWAAEILAILTHNTVVDGGALEAANHVTGGFERSTSPLRYLVRIEVWWGDVVPGSTAVDLGYLPLTTDIAETASAAASASALLLTAYVSGSAFAITLLLTTYVSGSAAAAASALLLTTYVSYVGAVPCDAVTAGWVVPAIAATLLS
jgi:hypothetical protein